MTELLAAASEAAEAASRLVGELRDALGLDDLVDFTVEVPEETYA